MKTLSENGEESIENLAGLRKQIPEVVRAGLKRLQLHNLVEEVNEGEFKLSELGELAIEHQATYQEEGAKEFTRVINREGHAQTRVADQNSSS
jgi:hypothetical protein